MFVAPERRAQFRESLKDPRRRKKLHQELYHFEDRLDPRFARLLEPGTKHDRHVEDVYALLVQSGAPPVCFPVTEREMDCQEVPLREAVEQLMWSGAGFISCVPGRLGLYVSEDGSNVFVLRRDA